MEHEFSDPADRAVDDSFREDLYADLHEWETEQERDKRIFSEAYREAAKKLLALIGDVLNYVHQGKKAKDVSYRLAIALKYFRHPEFADRSLTSIAASFEKTRAAGSASMVQFQRQCNLAELLDQKTESSREEYFAARKRRIESAS